MASEARPTDKLTRPTTLRDVAQLAGVSISTVSKSLNGREHVRPETRERVLLAAEKLKFAPNSLAQGLLTGRTGTVGLLTSDMDGRFSLPVLMGAEDAFGAGSTSAFLCDARGDAIREQHHIRALLGRRVDGLIVVGDKTDPRPSLGHDLPVPVVYAYAPSDDPDDMSVVSDNVQAGRLAAEHVISSGRRRIAYVAGDITYTAARDRVAGAVDALRATGLQLLGGEALYGAWTEEWGRGAIRTLVSRFPDLDAVLCGSDQIARGALDALRDLDRSVPQDVAVMAHDNWEPIATQARPPLSTIDMQLELIGRKAAELLFDAIDGDVRSGIHTVDTKLVTRASTVVA
ncbi:MAG: LacI family DNA-binding transcriptional regulator [Mycetocola sp.]